MFAKIKGFIAWWVWRSYYLMQTPGFDRKLRIVLDWTVALFFPYDIVKLDLFGDTHPTQRAPSRKVSSAEKAPEPVRI